MNSEALGKNTSVPEITNISSHGLWLLTGDNEFFMSYEDFPWFKDAPVTKITNIEEKSPGHFYWPDLDIDLSIESIKDPDQYPLMATDSHS